MKTTTTTGYDKAEARQGWQKAVRERMELHKRMAARERQQRNRRWRAASVEPEVAALTVELAKRSEKLSVDEIRVGLEEGLGKVCSRTTVSSILAKHGVRKQRDRERALEVESRIVEGLEVGPRMLARALRLNAALGERGGSGEGNEPGEVLTQTLFPIEPVEGKKRWHVHAVVDTYGVVGFAELHEDARMETAVELLDRRVLPWYAERGVRVGRMLTNRQRVFWGSESEHIYRVYLDLHGIEQQLIPVDRPTMNGSMVRFKQALTNEWLLPLRGVSRGLLPGESREGSKRDAVEGGAHRLEQLREHLAQWLEHYNREYPLQGYRNNGKAPLEFWKGKHSQ
ncbi:hypothetical protein [Geminisphaera colitermitum]|uniref:hypothetical protein n=1 Tax=Geminisphaera colitermitum TaxID=1148786 RepID=UPI00069338FD|nr:hypothetical protein [Geminisphaera colitermitum]